MTCHYDKIVSLIKHTCLLFPQTTFRFLENIEMAHFFERAERETRFPAMITRLSNYIPAISCQLVLLVSACKEPVAALCLNSN